MIYLISWKIDYYLNEYKYYSSKLKTKSYENCEGISYILTKIIFNLESKEEIFQSKVEK